MTLALLSVGRRRVFGIGAFVALLTLAFGIGGVLAQSTYTVSQKHRAFHPGILHVVAGEVVHVVNDDEFTHQIYVDSPTFKFDSDEAAPARAST